MSAVALPSRFAPQGALTMFTSTAALAEGRRMALKGPLLVDLGAVGAADSAALALILDWCVRRAARDRRSPCVICPQDLPVWPPCTV